MRLHYRFARGSRLKLIRVRQSRDAVLALVRNRRLRRFNLAILDAQTTKLDIAVPLHRPRNDPLAASDGHLVLPLHLEHVAPRANRCYPPVASLDGCLDRRAVANYFSR